MTVSAAYLTYIVDQLAPFSKVRARRMFGGVGLYADDIFFGLIDDDTLYLKVDDSNRDDYVVRGCRAFRPMADDPDAYSMSYFAVPGEVIEDSDELALWARKALAVAAAARLVRAARPSRKRAVAKVSKKKPRR